MAANFKPWAYASANTVSVVDGPTSNPKKITGTRLGKILDLDSWGSPFQAWCEITRVAEPPFDGSMHTDCGNALESKIIEWCKLNVSPYVYTPEEFYGVPDAKKAKRYDFYPNEPILGGMWDAIILSVPLARFNAGEGKALGYIEAKTSSRPQDWVDGPPPKYCVQGLQYAHLDGLERVYVPVRFTQPHELKPFDDFRKGKITQAQLDAHIATLECGNDNTFCYELRVAETLIGNNDIASCIENALAWYDIHVVGNVSPAFDTKKDAEYLKLMRSTEVTNDGLAALAMRAAVLESKIEDIRTKNKLDELEKELKLIKDQQLKPQLIEQFTATSDTVVAYGWQVKKTTPEYIDKEMMAADNVLDKYTKNDKPKYTMTKVKGQ